MKIAHFSDLHLCLEHGGRRQIRSVVQLFKLALQKGCEHFVVSGDIVEYANHQDLSRWLQGLQKLGIQGHQLTLIPGNHDVFPASPYRVWRSLFRFTKFPRYYERFLEIASPYLGEILHNRPLVQFRELNEKTVLYAVDTNDYQVKNHRLSGRGRLPLSIGKLIEDHIEAKRLWDRNLILAIHHHPFRWSTASGHEVNFIDLNGVQEWLTKINWKIILCGHAHSERGLHRLGDEHLVYNGSSNPKLGYFICSVIDVAQNREDIVPQKLEGRLFSGLRAIFARG